MTNLMWARVSALGDVKASGNWMYAAKLPVEGARMYDACGALKDAVLALGVGIEGGRPKRLGSEKEGGDCYRRISRSAWATRRATSSGACRTARRGGTRALGRWTPCPSSSGRGGGGTSLGAGELTRGVSE